MRMATRTLPVILGALAVALAAPVAGQNAEDILNTAMQKYEKRMEGIQNYTVVQEILGTGLTTYFERTDAGGRAVFLPRNVGLADAKGVDPYAEMSAMMAKARYAGRKDIAGVATHEIRIDDPEGIELGERMARSQQNADMTIESFVLFLDTKDHLVQRIEMAGQTKRSGKEYPVRFEVDFLDYRSVEGMVHPFRTVMRMEGMTEAADISEEDLAKARQSLEKLEVEMAKMPASQRAMMERMMGGQLTKLREMIESGGTEFTTDVKEVKVNTGPPKN